jgi:hypothetical protein
MSIKACSFEASSYPPKQQAPVDACQCARSALSDLNTQKSKCQSSKPNPGGKLKMQTLLKDRSSITAIYPFEIFEIEANENSRAEEATRHGLLIESSPECDGSFSVRRAIKSIGDPPEGPQTLFMCPYASRSCGFFGLEAEDIGAFSEELATCDPQPEDYDVFIDTVLAMAKNFRGLAPLDRDRLPKG